MVFTTINKRETTGFVYANVPSSTAKHRAGAIMSGLAIVILLFDSMGKLMQAPHMVPGSTQLVILLICLGVYLVPRTAVLGAILLTGYLGAAVAIQLRDGNPLLTHTVVPVCVAVLIWGGLLLREDRLRALVPVRR